MTSPEALEQFAERMEALTQSVTHLEHRVTCLEQQRHKPAKEESAPQVLVDQAALVGTGFTGNTLSTAGIALLGIAGAYLLRALSGSALLPRPLGASLDAVYSAGWAYLAARNQIKHRTGAMLYALASVLMLGPMLWEMCIQSQAMPATAAAVLLAGYIAAAAVFARGDRRAGWFSICWTGAAVIALALAIGVRAMLPFATILLAMAAWAEVSRLRRRPLAIAPVVVLAADACAWALLLIYRMPAEARPEYPQVPIAILLAVPLLLLAMHAASVALLACARGERISIFDMFQVSLALVLAGCGCIWLLPQSGRGACAALCAALAAGCYSAAFARPRIDTRNFVMFAAWVPALLVCAVFLVLDPPQASAAFALLAITAAAAARALRSHALAWHSLLYVALAEGASGLFAYTLHAIAGPAVAPLAPLMLLAAIAAAAAYAAARESAEEAVGSQALHLIAALLAAWPLNALLTHGLVQAASQFLTPSAFQLALVRTIALCGLAVALTLAGSRLRRVALVRAAYTLTAFAAAKLFFEDLRHGRLEFAAASIFLVAIALIAIPRLAAAKKSAL
jgi:hypothetical protein